MALSFDDGRALDLEAKEVQPTQLEKFRVQASRQEQAAKDRASYIVLPFPAGAGGEFIVATNSTGTTTRIPSSF